MSVPSNLVPLRLSQMPAVASLAGTELMWVSQNGVSKKATVAQVVAGGTIGALTAPFLVVSLDGTLPNERALMAGTGLNGLDGGAGGNFTLKLTDTGVAAGSYGDNTHVAAFTVDAQGRLVSVTSIDIDFPNTFPPEAANTVFAGPAAGAAAVPNFRALVTADLPNTAVAASSYGSATQVGAFTVDAKGRLTAASNVAIQAMVGASSGAAGTAGFVPQPAAGDEGKYLRGDATWQVNAGGTVTSVTGTTNQIDVATGTTTPVLSLSSTLIAPGSLSNTTGGTLTAITLAGTITLAGGGQIASSGYLGIGNSVVSIFDQVGGVRPGLFAATDTSTTIAGSIAALTVANLDTTTSNTAQLNFAAKTGANGSLFSGVVLSAVFGARTNGQYPTGDFVVSTSSTLNSAPTEKFRIAAAGAITFTGALTAAAFIPSGATIPANGMYLSGANTLAFATNSTLAMSFSSAQLATFTAGITASGTIRVANATGAALINAAATSTVPTLVPNITDNDTGWGYTSTPSLHAIINGASVGSFSATQMALANAAGPTLLNSAATATVPTVVPNKADPNTGLGWVSADVFSLIAGGVQVASGDASNFTTAGNLIVTGFVTVNGATGAAPFTITNAAAPELRITDTTGPVTWQAFADDTAAYVGSLTSHTFRIRTAGVTQASFNVNATANRILTFIGGTGTSPIISVEGGTNTGIIFQSLGNESLYFRNSTGGQGLRIGAAATLGNAVGISGVADGSTPLIGVESASGVDTTISLNIRTVGAGAMNFLSHSGAGQNFQILGVNNAVNYPTVSGAVTGANAIVSTNAANMQLMTGAALATSATAGMILIPATAGTPSGAVVGAGAGAIPFIVDTSALKLWALIAGTWRFTQLT